MSHIRIGMWIDKEDSSWNNLLNSMNLTRQQKQTNATSHPSMPFKRLLMAIEAVLLPFYLTNTKAHKLKSP
jgi:hypothetical protein